MSWPTCKPFLCFPHRPLGHSFTFLTYLWIIIVISWPTWRSLLWFLDLLEDHYCDFLTYLKVIIVVSWPTWRSLLWFPDLLDGHYCGFLTYLTVIIVVSWPTCWSLFLRSHCSMTRVHSTGPAAICFYKNKLTPLYCTVQCSLEIVPLYFKYFQVRIREKTRIENTAFFPGSRYWHGLHGPVSSACGFFCWIVHGRWPPTAPTSICMNCCGPNCFALVKIRDQISNLEWPLLKVSYSLSSCLLLSIVIHCWYSFAD